MISERDWNTEHHNDHVVNEQSEKKNICWPQPVLANKVCKSNLLVRWKNLTNSSWIFHSKANYLRWAVAKSCSLRQGTFLCRVVVKEVLHPTSEKSGFLLLYSLLSLFPFQSIFHTMCSYINKNASSVRMSQEMGSKLTSSCKKPTVSALC